MTRGFANPLRRHASSPAALVALLLFGYGAAVIGFLFRVGAISGLQLAAALQATSVPVLFASVWATSAERPVLVPAFALAPAVGVATRMGVTAAPTGGYGDAVAVSLVVAPTVAGFAVSWAVLGYVGGTALRWGRRRDRISRLELLGTCSLVLAGTVLTWVLYGVFWTYFVVGLGDVA